MGKQAGHHLASGDAELQVEIDMRISGELRIEQREPGGWRHGQLAERQAAVVIGVVDINRQAAAEFCGILGIVGGIEVEEEQLAVCGEPWRRYIQVDVELVCPAGSEIETVLHAYAEAEMKSPSQLEH